MKFLITGHTGFKGSWLAMMLKVQGHEIVGISLPACENSLYTQAELKDVFNEEHFIDIRQRGNLREAVEASKVDFAFHLAAQPLVRQSYITPIETFETNVIGTLNFLDAIKDSDIKGSLVVTTDKVYKNMNHLRGYVESDELGGRDPYSASKAAADIATQSWISSQELENISIARAGNVVGGGDWATDRLIPNLVSSFIAQRPAQIRYPEAIRPWQHVLDCLSGYIRLSDAMLRSGIHGIWNFGPEIRIENTVGKVADAAALIWGNSASWDHDSSSHLHESGYLLLDSSKARAELEWKDFLNFESTIEWTLSFYSAVAGGENSRDLLENQVNTYLSMIAN